MHKKPTRILLDLESYASLTDVSFILSDVRVTGWIHGRNRKHIFEVCKVLAGYFGVKHTGAFCMDEDSTSAPFSFDISPAWLSRPFRREEKDELMARVQKLVRKAVREGNKAVRLMKEAQEAAPVEEATVEPTCQALVSENNRVDVEEVACGKKATHATEPAISKPMKTLSILTPRINAAGYMTKDVHYGSAYKGWIMPNERIEAVGGRFECFDADGYIGSRTTVAECIQLMHDHREAKAAIERALDC